MVGMAKTTFDTVLYEKQRPLAFVTLNRPQQLNAFNLRMRDDLFQVFEAVRDDPEVEAAILSGAGERAFCVGADLTEFGRAPSQAIARDVRWKRDLWGLMLDLDKLLVAAVHGYTLGSGAEMALCCDLRLAAEDAQFGFPEAGWGLIPAAGGTQTLPRLVGKGRALEMLLTGRLVGAQEALAMGLVNWVVPKVQLRERAREVCQQITSRGAEFVQAVKRAVREGVDLPLTQGRALEEALFQRFVRQGNDGAQTG